MKAPEPKLCAIYTRKSTEHNLDLAFNSLDAAGGIERLGHGHEGHGVLVEQFHQLGEIRQRPGQPVDLVDHHDVDLAGPDLGQQALQGRAIERGSRQAAVVVMVGD
jgi:hypothetical protein